MEWKRNEVIVQNDSNHETSQIIVNTSFNAVYENTLRVRGREGGNYTCNVSDNALHNYTYLHKEITSKSFRVEGTLAKYLQNYNNCSLHAYSCTDA